MPRHAADPQTDAQRAGEAFEALFRASVQRAQAKRESRTYPYDLEVGR